MKLIYSVLIWIFITPCYATSYLKSVRYTFRNDSTIVVLGKIPIRWCEYKQVAYGNNIAITQYLYIYSDSSVFYVTNNYNDPYFPNATHIDSLNSTESMLRRQDHSYVAMTNKQLTSAGVTTLISETPYYMMFSGKDKDDLYWADIKYGNISIGYTGVTEANKKLFDDAIESFKVK